MRRRDFLQTVAIAGATAPLVACEALMRRLAVADNSGFSPTSHSFTTSDLCALNAEAIRGPFYIPETLVRREIAEDHAGVPLRLQLRVVDVDGCRPLEGMSVEVWHCDAEGNYSGYPSYPPDEFPMVGPSAVVEPEDGQRFCRGAQFSDVDGRVDFETIVPGWYTPRTPHVHVRVAHPGTETLTIEDERLVLTNQLYFPDALTAELFASTSPYRERGPSPYTNANDRIIHDSGGADGGFLTMSRDGQWHTGSITLGVNA